MNPNQIVTITSIVVSCEPLGSRHPVGAQINYADAITGELAWFTDDRWDIPAIAGHIAVAFDDIGYIEAFRFITEQLGERGVLEFPKDFNAFKQQ